jgi:NAD(P)-dependent dehydrogenase (short-subunit alcohol dehydrogenase family)
VQWRLATRLADRPRLRPPVTGPLHPPRQELLVLDLTGTSSLVTGGASGLGEATVRALAARGASVVVVDLQDEKGEAVARSVGGGYVRADVTDAGQVAAAVSAAEEHGELRTLVCAAGIGWASRTVGRDGSFESAHDLAAFSKVISINLIGTFNCIRLAATAMGRTTPVDDAGSRGAIVTLASIAAFDGQIGQAAYSASKGGIVGMTLPVARDLAAIGVRVNCVAPGLIDTPDLRRGAGRGGVQGQAQAGRALPQAARHAGRAGLHGRRAAGQQLRQRRGRPAGRRSSAAAEVAVRSDLSTLRGDARTQLATGR